jgi:hypothetical protein
MKYRYEVRGQEDGGKYRRFYVWDTKEKRVHKGNIVKYDAIGLEHSLNNRKFKSVQ